jgi:hypothetical protein
MRGIPFETRVRGVVLALIVVSALSANVGELKRIWELPLQPAADKISDYEKRFAPLKNTLPKRGVVGFVTDARTRDEQLKRRYLAGYALAPIVVAPGADRPLVVGDFADPATARFISAEGLRVHEHLGGGLVVLAPEER